ncbi:hypothetical protein AB0I84_34675 [Streptomyces spectabilis]|uniref:hypothetical protein n=1 Tax=Streptomyces spectabilis TaxID=68270 RepID=UPI00340AE914
MTKSRKILVTLAVMAAASAGAAAPAFADSHSPAAPHKEGHGVVTPLGDGHFPAPPGDGQMPSTPRN